MGRFDERYSEAQRVAVGRCILEPDPITGKKVGAKEAIERLMDGRLGVTPPPLPMPKSTAYYCRDREAARQKGHELSPLAKQALADPVQVNERLAQRLVSIYERQLDRAEQQLAKDKLDPALFRLLTQTFRDVSASVRKPDPRKPGTYKTPANPKDHGPKPEDAIGKLIEQHRKSARGNNGAKGEAEPKTTAEGTSPDPASEAPDSAAPHSGLRDSSSTLPHAYA